MGMTSSVARNLASTSSPKRASGGAWYFWVLTNAAILNLHFRTDHVGGFNGVVGLKMNVLACAHMVPSSHHAISGQPAQLQASSAPGGAYLATRQCGRWTASSGGQGRPAHPGRAEHAVLETSAIRCPGRARLPTLAVSSDDLETTLCDERAKLVGFPPAADQSARVMPATMRSSIWKVLWWEEASNAKLRCAFRFRGCSGLRIVIALPSPSKLRSYAARCAAP